MNSVVNINGEIQTPENAKISVFDRGFLYGDSIYEVTLTYNKVPFLLDDHYDRLWQSAEKMNMPMIFSREELSAEIQKVIDELNEDRIYIRLIITRGEGAMGLDPNLSSKHNLIVIGKKLPENPSWWYTKGVDVIVATDIIRNHKKATDPSIKSGNYLNNVLAINEAKKRGAFDAVMLNHKGNITEGTTFNIWMVKDKKIMTPPLAAGLLEGITRKTLLRLLKESEQNGLEQDFNHKDFLAADEIFLTGSVKGIVPITKVDGLVIGNGAPGKITLGLMKLYQQFIDQETAL